MSKLSAKQRETAEKIIAKHGFEKVYVKITNGHCYSKEGRAKFGLTDEEFKERFEVVEAPAKKEPAKPKSSKGTAQGEGEKDDKVVIPDGDPNKDWTKDQLIAYGGRKFPDLKLTKSMKEDTILDKLAEAAKPAEAPESGKEENAAEGAADSSSEETNN